MRVLVTGGGGFIGSRLVEALVREGHEVVCCVRDPSGRGLAAGRAPTGRVTYIAADLTKSRRLADWLPRLKNIDAVANAAGIIRERGSQTFGVIHADAPKALFDACAAAGVRRVVQISALGADEGAESRFHLTKKEADDYLAALPLDSVVVQPSIVYGEGGDTMRLFEKLAALPITPLIGDGGQQIQPIHVEDLASGIVQLLGSAGKAKSADRTAAPGTRVAAVGPEPVTVAQTLAVVRRWLGLRPSPTLRIPLPLMRLIARAGDFTGAGAVSSEALQMLLRGNTASPEGWVGATGVHPRSITDALPEASAPQSELRSVRLALLQPVVRWSIGFIWIVTGLVSAFFYPIEQSYELLSRAGVTRDLAPFVLFPTSAFEIILGLATLARYRIRLVGLLQLALIFGFTVIITVRLPEFWIHPFGPLTKNIPIIAATLMMMALEEPGRR